MNLLKNAKFIKGRDLVLFPALLLLFSLVGMNQGIDVSDPLYSLTTFRFLAKTGGSAWSVATFLANILGAGLMHLPFGSTLLGMNFYTRCLIGGMALLGYFFLKGKMPSWAAFLGEMIAVGFCWCPSTILYNYATYFLFLGCVIALYRGLIWKNNKLLILAGILLGLNVNVRFPNIVEAALILAVFYYGMLTGRNAKQIWSNVGFCVGGFLAGFLVPVLLICVIYGPASYGAMFGSLFGYSSTDASYSPLSMITSILECYTGTLPWAILTVVCAAAGFVMLTVLPKKLKKAGKVVYLLCIPVLFRLLWGKGVYTFTYYNYRSFYEWGMLLIYLAWISCILTLCDRSEFRRDKLMAVLILLGMVILPIGSNNGIMPVLNCMFLAAPFVIRCLHRQCLKYQRADREFALLAMACAVTAMCLVQGIGFRSQFAFGDGINGEKRTAKVENSAILRGVYTRPEIAQMLEELVEEAGPYTDRTLVTLGNAPGLHYILNMKPALSHTWPDLGTYPETEFVQELNALQGDLPLVIVYKEQGFPWEERTLPEGEKWEILTDYMDKNDYRIVYENTGYLIYGN